MNKQHTDSRTDNRATRARQQQPEQPEPRGVRPTTGRKSDNQERPEKMENETTNQQQLINN